MMTSQTLGKSSVSKSLVKIEVIEYERYLSSSVWNGHISVFLSSWRINSEDMPVFVACTDTLYSMTVRNHLSG